MSKCTINYTYDPTICDRNAQSIPVGTWFTGTIGNKSLGSQTYSGLFLREYYGIVWISNPEVTWNLETNDDLVIQDYCPVNVEIRVTCVN